MTDSLLIENCRLYNVSETEPPCSILIEDGRIVRVGPQGASDSAKRIIDATGTIVAPGLIDVHIQGAGGADVFDATPEALKAISATSARFGVTGFLATTMYRPGKTNEHVRVAAQCVGQDLGGAELLGIHLEGPFIALEKRGMIAVECLGQAELATLEAIYELTGSTLKMMTIAPELPGNLEIIKILVDRGTVAALGHTCATYEETLAGFDAGIDHVTHLFNAMPSIHHRMPGPAPAIFERSNVTAQVISDGVHLHPSIVRMAYEALGPERVVSITDGMQAMGLPDGRYVFNGKPYEAKDGAARYKDGTLIGTAVGLNEIIARLARFTGCSLATAIGAATQNAARVIGLQNRKGSIEAGYDADLVLLGQDMSVKTTILGGRVIYQA